MKSIFRALLNSEHTECTSEELQLDDADLLASAILHSRKRRKTAAAQRNQTRMATAAAALISVEIEIVCCRRSVA